MVKAGIITFAFLSMLMFGTASIFGQTTEFIYQGQLQNASAPASGNFDFEFLLFDAAAGGNQIGATVTRSNVVVANGIFSVPIDFGSNFPGASRFLEIHVRQNGGGAFTPLTPRQPISSTPYSVKSLNADNATNAVNAATAATATNAANATNASNAALLNGQPAGFYQNAASLNSGTVDPARFPVPLTLTGASGTHIIRADNAATTTNATGIFGAATSASGVNYGVLGETRSSSTPSVPNQNNVPAGVYGRATVTSGFNVGVLGYTPSTDGAGVAGLTSALSGANVGVFGSSPSTGGAGVRGEATATSGNNSGLSGVTNSPQGFGVFAFGAAGASGTKSFRIDHPDDPTNKFLFHYSSESPEVINFYRGTVVLDKAGEAIVELPPYFAKINKDPSYTLTAVGAPMPMLHVAREIDEASLKAGAMAGPEQTAPLCSFRIAGGVPGAKVSWRIDAVRNDLWTRSRKPSVETDKSGPDKGTYQHPDLYGQPAEKGINYRPAVKTP